MNLVLRCVRTSLPNRFPPSSGIPARLSVVARRRENFTQHTRFPCETSHKRSLFSRLSRLVNQFLPNFTELCMLETRYHEVQLFNTKLTKLLTRQTGHVANWPAIDLTFENEQGKLSINVRVAVTANDVRRTHTHTHTRRIMQHTRRYTVHDERTHRTVVHSRNDRTRMRLQPRVFVFF